MLLLGSANVGKTSLFSKFFWPGDSRQDIDIDAIMHVPTVLTGGEQGGSPLAQGRQLFLDVIVEEKESRMIFVESRVNDNAQVVQLFLGHINMKANRGIQVILVMRQNWKGKCQNQ